MPTWTLYAHVGTAVCPHGHRCMPTWTGRVFLLITITLNGCHFITGTPTGVCLYVYVVVLNLSIQHLYDLFVINNICLYIIIIFCTVYYPVILAYSNISICGVACAIYYIYYI